MLRIVLATAAAALAVTAALTLPPRTATASSDAVAVHDIQGDGWLSPYAGRSVSGVTGVVTAVRGTGSSKGYWLQDPTPDADAATSEGIFVYTGGKPSVAAGDAVTVSGKVNEYYPLASGESTDTTSTLSTTEIGGATTTVTAHDQPLAAPVVLDPPDTYAPDNGGRSIENAPLQPRRDALDYYESLEGMRVEVDDARVVGPSDSYGEQYVTIKPDQDVTYRGGTELLAENATPSGRLEVVAADGSNLALENPGVDVGDVFTGATVGPLDWTRYGGYALVATTLGTVQHNNLAPAIAHPSGRNQLSIATYNVENLAPTDAAAKFTRLAQGVVADLGAPDVVALEEVQDDTGATDDGTVTAGSTLTKLTDAIRAAGGPSYRWREVDPVNDQDGGQPGGNIRDVFLFDPSRVSFVDTGGSGTDRSTTATRVVRGRGGAALTLSPGRIDPANPVWTDSRKPLVGQFRLLGPRGGRHAGHARSGRTVTVIANHFDSKLGDQNADGRYQYPAQASATQRAGQALVVHDFVGQLLAADRRAEVVVLGDLNDYQFSPALQVLKTGAAAPGGTPTLTDLITTLPVDQQYTYDYQGVSEVLDHILVTRAVRHVDYQVVHVNAEYHDQVSDHDPQVAAFTP